MALQPAAALEGRFLRQHVLPRPSLPDAGPGLFAAGFLTVPGQGLLHHHAAPHGPEHAAAERLHHRAAAAAEHLRPRAVLDPSGRPLGLPHRALLGGPRHGRDPRANEQLRRARAAGDHGELRQLRVVDVREIGLPGGHLRGGVRRAGRGAHHPADPALARGGDPALLLSLGRLPPRGPPRARRRGPGPRAARALCDQPLVPEVHTPGVAGRAADVGPHRPLRGDGFAEHDLADLPRDAAGGAPAAPAAEESPAGAPEGGVLRERGEGGAHRGGLAGAGAAAVVAAFREDALHRREEAVERDEDPGEREDRRRGRQRLRPLVP
mmetsp:Transcript_89397/g.257873  ORF Transcript_89397/g.257873 Transcript_89397/m.257873 type:complete len:323 (-) Transcript_89397:2019-2987(-)